MSVTVLGPARWSVLEAVCQAEVLHRMLGRAADSDGG